MKTIVVDPGMRQKVVAFKNAMKPQDLADILGVTRRTIWRMTRKGLIPRFVIPGMTVVRFDPAHIAQWLDSLT